MKLASELMATPYVEELFAEKVLSEDEKEELVDMKANRSNQAKCFLDIMLHKSENSIEKFFKILKENKDQQSFLYDILYPPQEEESDQAATQARAQARAQAATQAGAQATPATTKETAGKLNKDAVVTTKQMQMLSKKVGSAWSDIGLNLELEFQELDDIEQERKKLDARLLEVLKKWKKREGDNAKVGILLRACKDAGVGGEAERTLKEAIG
jgi:hypothetical protein